MGKKREYCAFGQFITIVDFFKLTFRSVQSYLCVYDEIMFTPTKYCIVMTLFVSSIFLSMGSVSVAPVHTNPSFGSPFAGTVIKFIPNKHTWK